MVLIHGAVLLVLVTVLMEEARTVHNHTHSQHSSPQSESVVNVKLSLRDGNTNKDMCKITSPKFIIAIAVCTTDYVHVPNIGKEICSKNNKQGKWETIE